MTARKLRDTDGTRLLFYDEVAEKTGNRVTTIRAYNSFAGRRREEGTADEFDFPAPRKFFKRVTIKSDGKPITARTPVWREDDIAAWMGRKRGPYGRIMPGYRRETRPDAGRCQICGKLTPGKDRRTKYCSPLCRKTGMRAANLRRRQAAR